MARLDVGVALAGALPAVLLAVLPIWVWLRRGRDPYYADDDSVLLPEPPAGFSAAAATIVLDDHASGRTMTAGLMNLASRNLIRFEEEPAPMGRRAGLRLTGQPGERQLPGPDAALYKAVAGVARSMGGYIDPLNMASLSGGFEEFGRMLQQEAATRGWLAGRTDLLIRRWRSLAAVEFLGGLFMAGWLSRMNLAGDSVSELDLGIIGFSWMVSGAVTFILSGFQPARTREGAMLVAMLRAYGRTLKATIAQSSSINEVVARKPLPWVSTPEEHVAWAVAFHLDREVERILSNSLEVSMTGGWPRDLHEMISLF